MEEWKHIQDYEGLYEVSDKGQVRSYYTGKVLKPKKGNGYYRVCLYKDGKQKTFLVHRLVYEAFCGKIPEGMVIDHVDGVKNNDCFSNLRCCTPKENVNNPVTRPRYLEAIRKRSQSPEWRKKNADAIRKTLRKLHDNPEYRKKQSDAMRKLAQSPEWRKNMTDAIRKARNKAVIQIDKTTGQTIKRFECARDAERELGIHNENISACCLGKIKSAGGYRWKFS